MPVGLRVATVSLIKDTVQADDLVQETVLRAWSNADRFEKGTCLDAWLFTILRNQFHSQHRRRRREVEDADGSYCRQLRCPPPQQHHVDFADLRAALAQLPLELREAVILVGAQGFSYEEAATICSCAIGTIKSRVHRARTRLGEILQFTDEDFGGDHVVQAAMATPD